MHAYPVRIRHLFISPGHNYFGHAADAPGAHPTHDVEAVAARAGLGLVGDRFFGVRKDFDGQVTFFAWEVYRQLVTELGLGNVGPDRLRRNVVIEGVALNALIGRDFALHFAAPDHPDGTESVVQFHGARQCYPCRWMDRAVAPGALSFLKGRGGLRAQLCSGGILYRDAATLWTDVALAPDSIVQPLRPPRLP